MPLGEKGLRQHLELALGLHNANHVKLLHELLLCLLEQEVPLVGLGATVVVEGPQEEAAEEVLQDVRDAILEARSVQEGKEEIAHVAVIDALFLLELPLEVLLIGLDDFELPLHGVGRGGLPSLGGLVLEVFVPPDVVDLPNNFAHEQLLGEDSHEDIANAYKSLKQTPNCAQNR